MTRLLLRSLVLVLSSQKKHDIILSRNVLGPIDVCQHAVMLLWPYWLKWKGQVCIHLSTLQLKHQRNHSVFDTRWRSAASHGDRTTTLFFIWYLSLLFNLPWRQFARHRSTLKVKTFSGMQNMLLLCLTTHTFSGTEEQICRRAVKRMDNQAAVVFDHMQQHLKTVMPGRV